MTTKQTHCYIGAAHPFYQYGESYTLRKRKVDEIYIAVEQLEGMVITASIERYATQAAFEKDWQPVTVKKER